MKYLVIDDNKNFRKLLREDYFKEDDEVKELNDGRDLIKAYKEFSPGLVLMDIQLKTVNGFTAVENLKKEYPDARIIMVSNYSDEKFEKKAKKVGAEELISKENLVELKKIISSK